MLNCYSGNWSGNWTCNVYLYYCDNAVIIPYLIQLLGFSFIYRKIGFHTFAVFNLYRQAIVNHQPTISDLALIPFQHDLCFFLFGTLSDVFDHIPLLSNEN